MSHMQCRDGIPLIALLLIVVPAGCGRQPASRAPAEISEERRKLSTLYINPDTGDEFSMPGSAGAVVDPKTGTLAFRAWFCRNPDCPGRKAGGERARFCWNDSLFYIKPDGTVEYDVVVDRAVETIQRDGTLLPRCPEPRCPECLKVRNLATETPKVRQRYAGYCVEYVLPETKRRERELHEEYGRRIAWERAHGMNTSDP